MHSKEPASFLAPLCRNPKLIMRVLRAVFNKHIKARREYRRADGYSRIPIQQVSIKITNACNLTCRTCAQWGDTGYNFRKSGAELKNNVSVSRYTRLSDRLKKHKPFYYIWGGEPFLYPGLMDLTARIKQNKSVLSLVTNATFLEDNAKEIVEQGWDALMFSLDGPEDVHDRIRGKKGTFKKVVKGIAEVKKYKRDLKKGVPYLLPLVTISRWNAGKLTEIFDTAREIGVDCLVVYYSWFTNEEVGNAHTRVFEEKFDVTPSAWRGFLFDHNVDTNVLIDSLKQIRKRQYKFPVIYIPNLKDNQLTEYYKNPAEFFGYGPCISPWLTAEIMPNGDVSPCRDYPDYITGNILEYDLEEIWNCERYVKFRKILAENGGTFPICSRCCGLMGW